MEAQKLITMSINKIAGSRRQRGGINLRKNLLVASVLHSARIHYYEEMCNRMPAGHISLEQSKPEPTMDDDDCTESPDWENEEENDHDETNYDEESDEEDNEIAGNSACENESSSRVVVEQIVSADKENVFPSGHCHSENSENIKPENNGHPAPDCDRVAFSNVSQNSAPEACTTTTCLTVPSVKRKRTTESEENCGEPIVSKRVKVDSQCQTVSSPDCGAQSSISTLVDIFKAGFHGLAGEPGSKLSSYKVELEEQDSSSNTTPSYTTLSTHSRPFETLQAAAVIAAC